MIALAHLARAVFGTGPTVAGLLCAPTSPASMSVTVSPGSIYALTNVDGTPYGSLGSDTSNTVVKQGINFSTQTFACPAPSTAGQSIVYLIAAAYTDSDTGSAVLTYFNSTNPAMPFTGPGNTGSSQPTVRQGLCSLQAVAGTPATTGSQTIPAASAGYTGLYTITVAYGATIITSANIALLATAPTIPYTLPQLRPGFGNIQELTVSGTWTVPANVTQAKVRLWGGGGGGGFTGSVGGGSGGGGGGAAYSERIITGLIAGTAIAVTVGAGGSGAGAGGTSSFGSYLSATGGGAGGAAASGSGGGGGVASGGSLNLGGGIGGGGSSGTAIGGGGGGAPLGGAGGPGSAGLGPSGVTPGGGGAGAGSASASSGATGGAGLVIVEY